jgi:GNAT superfamily N-acetyltransferase
MIWYKNACMGIYFGLKENYMNKTIVLEALDVNNWQKICDLSVTDDQKTFFPNKDDVVGFYRDLINHLRASPVFYPCNEFLPIDERFNDYLSDDIRVFAVFDKAKLIGMVISESSDKEIATGDNNAMMMGDLFVVEKYRGNGIAASLLGFANNELKKAESADCMLLTGQ